MNAGETAQQQQISWAGKLREDLVATSKFWRSRRKKRPKLCRLDDALWKRWATAVSHVERDVQSTAHVRDVFQQFSALVRDNESWIAEHEGLFFCRFIADAYVAKVASGVRRHVKRGDDSNSLLRILSQLRECAPQLTFEFFLRQFPAIQTTPRGRKVRSSSFRRTAAWRRKH
jgi:hypothetical protein